MVRRVEAVIVNHDTSRFAELALRTLRTRNTSGPEIRCTIADNHSSDDMSGLRAAARECDAEIVTTRWPAGGKVNSHGDVLRDFVLDRPDCDAYLFCDSDVWFCEDCTIGTMARELESDDDVWAVQARFSWDGDAENPMGSWGPDSPRSLGGHVHLGTSRVLFQPPTAEQRAHPPEGFHTGSIMQRLHPACALVRNTPALRRVAEHVGFSCAWVWSDDPMLGGYCDTMALATQTMRVAGFRFLLSDAIVGHFFNVSYDQTEGGLVAKAEQCEALLAELG